MTKYNPFTAKNGDKIIGPFFEATIKFDPSEEFTTIKIENRFLYDCINMRESDEESKKLISQFELILNNDFPR